MAPIRRRRGSDDQDVRASARLAVVRRVRIRAERADAERLQRRCELVVPARSSGCLRSRSRHDDRQGRRQLVA